VNYAVPAASLFLGTNGCLTSGLVGTDVAGGLGAVPEAGTPVLGGIGAG